MDFYEVLNKRRSVRDFIDEEVPREVLERIIDAAFKAPSNDHMYDWEFVVITDKKVTAKLLDIIPKDFSDEDLEKLFVDWNLNDKIQQDSYRLAVPIQHKMLFEPGALIVPLMKIKTDIMHPENISQLNPYASIWCAIENILLAATYEGYGSNLRVAFENENIHAHKVLNVPDDYLIPCFIGVGRSAPDAKLTMKKEIDTKKHIHWDGY